MELLNEFANQTAGGSEPPPIHLSPVHPSAWDVLEVIVLLLIFALTLVGNVALWIVVLSNKELRKVSNYHILCLSAADILVIALNLPFTVTTILQGGWQLGDVFCQVLGFVNMVTFVTSTTSLAAISVNRYFMIVHPGRYSKIYTKSTTAVIITGVWVFSAACSMPPLFGWASYTFIPDTSICFCSWKEHPGYTVFMFSMGFVLPSSAMMFCHIGIWRRYKGNRRKLSGSRHQKQLNQKPKTQKAMDKADITLVPNTTIQITKASPQFNDKKKSPHSPQVVHVVICLSKNEKIVSQNTVLDNTEHTSTCQNDAQSNGKAAHTEIGQGSEDNLVEDTSPDKPSVNSSEGVSLDNSDDREKSDVDKQDETDNHVVKPEKLLSVANNNRNLQTNRKQGSVVFLSDLSISKSPKDNDVSTGGDDGSATFTSLTDMSYKVETDCVRRRIKRKQKKDEAALTRSLMVVILVFVICWSPYAITTMGQVIGQMHVPRAVNILALVLGYFNSCCNPFVYGLMNRRFREGFAKLFHLNCGRKMN